MKIGLRTVSVSRGKLTKADGSDNGEEFAFTVNGLKIFAMGANYIPEDQILPRRSAQLTERLLNACCDANYNMIRVWGGGIYPDDWFYELCDQMGLLVWQDCMFACSAYRAEEDFCDPVRAEIADNAKRIRNHPSLAMWCGNNEVFEGMKYWGWKSRYSPEVYAKMRSDYDKLFRELLPAKVQQWDEGRFYVHTSPYFANWGRPESWGTGDSHNWGIWYGEKPFESADTEIGRFQSEFGFESFPEMKTIGAFAPRSEYAEDSDAMKSNQKSSMGNDLIRRYMERDYVVPERFEDFVYVGLVMQGRGMRHCFEAHRRNRPYCMGSLYW